MSDPILSIVSHFDLPECKAAISGIRSLSRRCGDVLLESDWVVRWSYDHEGLIAVGPYIPMRRSKKRMHTWTVTRCGHAVDSPFWTNGAVAVFDPDNELPDERVFPLSGLSILDLMAGGRRVIDILLIQHPKVWAYPVVWLFDGVESVVVDSRYLDVSHTMFRVSDLVLNPQQAGCSIVSCGMRVMFISAMFLSGAEQYLVEQLVREYYAIRWS